jgi:chorismate mutase
MAAELSLEALREEIDRIDEVIVRLLDSRARCAYAVGRVKRERGLAIYEPAREAAVMAHVKDVNARLGGPLDGDAIMRLYERVMDEARRIQRIEHDKTAGPDATAAHGLTGAGVMDGRAAEIADGGDNRASGANTEGSSTAGPSSGERTP